MSAEAGVQFASSQPARIVEQSAGQTGRDLVAALHLEQPPAVILVIGGAATLQESAVPALRQLFGRGVARAAVETKAVVIDGGTRAGVIALVGDAMSEFARGSIHLGVAPASRVDRDPTRNESIDGRAPLDPNHSHFVLTLGHEWGDETGTMYDVAGALADGGRAVTIVAGGGRATLREVVHSVRRHWPIIVVEGSGGAADRIADACGAQSAAEDDDCLSEILAEGELELFPITGSPESFRRMVIRAVRGDASLRLAWERFAALDAVSSRQQKSFNLTQLVMLTLGVSATSLAIAQQIWFGTASPARSVIHYVLLALPVLLSILIAATNRFKTGNKWMLTRAAAEAIKREIFRYRVRAGQYRDPPGREGVLAQRIEDVTRRLMRTEANAAAVPRYAGRIPPPMFAADAEDDGFSALTADRYVDIRIRDQLDYFRRRIIQLERKGKRLQLLILMIGGAATILAAVDQEILIPVATAIVTAITIYLGYRQVDTTVTTYNQTATDLENLRGWWVALSPTEQTDPQKLDKLVEHTEKVLQAELDGWIQRMQDALADLRKEQEEQQRNRREAKSTRAGSTATNGAPKSTS